MNNLCRIPNLVLIVVFSCMLTTCGLGCSGDYAHELPNGYKLVRTNANTIAVFAKGGGIPIPPKIIEYNIADHYVYGSTINSPDSELALSLIHI